MTDRASDTGTGGEPPAAADTPRSPRPAANGGPERDGATNFDPEELAKFEALAERWWDPDGEFKPLHDINPLRLAYIDDAVGLAGKRVLDVGCGGGILAEAMADAGAEVLAVDLAPGPLAVARLHAHSVGADVAYERVSAEALAEREPGRYDIVTCLELLEHVPRPDSTIAACAALTRPGGAVFFSTINRNPRSYLFAIIGAEHLLRLLPVGTHDYRKFLRPSELDRFARPHRLALEDLVGMHYNPVSGRYRLAPGVAVNYLARYRRDSGE